MSQQKRVAVLGGGISGLCVAYGLCQKKIEVDLYEKSSRFGGVLFTQKSENFLMDFGPNSVLADPLLDPLIEDLGLSEEKIEVNPASKKRYILCQHKLQALPHSLLSFAKTPLFSTSAKLRLLAEPLVSRSREPEISLAEFIRRRLGKPFLDYAVNPFVAGVYGGDPEKLGAGSAFPKLYQLEQKYGSLFKGVLLEVRSQKKKSLPAQKRRTSFSFRGGMEVLSQRLVEKIGLSSLHPDTEVLRIEAMRPEEEGYRLSFSQGGQVYEKTFAALVLALPTYKIAPLLSPWDPALADQIETVEYPPLSVVFMGFKESQVQHPLDGFGFLVPEVEKRHILGTLWSSSLFPQRAPRGSVALTTFVGGSRQPELALLPPTQLYETVLKDLRDFLGVSGIPQFCAFQSWERAIPQYHTGYSRVQKAFEAFESRFSDLYFAGNYLKGVGLVESIRTAFEVVEKISSSSAVFS
jgi:oxygen-dependent protoporphyrinogen oxidase